MRIVRSMLIERASRFGSGLPGLYFSPLRRQWVLLPTLILLCLNGNGVAEETRPMPTQEQASAAAPSGDTEAQRRISEMKAAREAADYERAVSASAWLLDHVRSRLGERHPTYVAILGEHAVNLFHAGRPNEAEPLHRQVVALRTQSLGERHPATQSALFNLGVTVGAQGRDEEAEGIFRTTLRLALEVSGEKSLEAANSLGALGNVLGTRGQLREAEALARRAYEISKDLLGESHNTTISRLKNVAKNIDRQGRYSEAEQYFRAILAERQRAHNENDDRTASAHSDLGQNLLAQGRYDEAAPLLRESLRGFQNILGDKHPVTFQEQAFYAFNLNGQRRFRAAEPHLRNSALLHRETFGDLNPWTLVVEGHLAWNLLSQGKGAEALEPARRSVAGWRLLQARLGNSPGNEGKLEQQLSMRQSFFTLLSDAAWATAIAKPTERSPLQGEAFSALQEVVAGATATAVAKMAARKAVTGLADLVRNRQELEARWRANDLKQTAALTREGAEVQAERRRLADEGIAIDSQLRKVDAQLQRSFPEYFALVRPNPLSLKATQDLLAPDEALLLVVPSEFGTHVFGVSRTNSVWARSEWPAEKISAAVRRLLWDVGANVDVDRLQAAEWALKAGPGYPYDRSTAYSLYQQVVAPVAEVLRGKRHLFVVSGGSLSSLPFAVLVTEQPRGADGNPLALRATKWFADAHALIQMPSVQSLQFLRRFGRNGSVLTGNSSSFLGFGDPLLQGEPMQRGRSRGRGGLKAASLIKGQTRSGSALADVGQIKQMARLSGTAEELENMRAALEAKPDALFLRERATETNVRTTDLSGARILALATHGLLAGELEGAAEPGLVFTPPAVATEQDDGLLTASEVSALRLDADWVIMSACNTAAGDGSEGAPGLSGLARAFFYAGARNLLASHWPVRDDVAARLTVRTILLQRETPGLSRAEALQRAMRETRNDASHDSADDTWAHPNAWAPFTLIGDGAR